MTDRHNNQAHVRLSYLVSLLEWKQIKAHQCVLNNPVSNIFLAAGAEKDDQFIQFVKPELQVSLTLRFAAKNEQGPETIVGLENPYCLTCN